jgi:hypothetical protein
MLPAKFHFILPKRFQRRRFKCETLNDDWYQLMAKAQIAFSLKRSGGDPINRFNLITFVCLSTARTWISTLHVCACPQPGPGFPHYIFVPVHSQDLNFHTTLLCLSTARTWISTLHFCACPQPGPGFPHYMSVPVHSQDLDFHTTFVCLSTARTWISTLHLCACPQPGPGFPH